MSVLSISHFRAPLRVSGNPATTFTYNLLLYTFRIKSADTVRVSRVAKRSFNFGAHMRLALANRWDAKITAEEPKQEESRQGPVLC